jgi:putative toxin-antitoxin system antitoxin component (TIGR02293 family)
VAVPVFSAERVLGGAPDARGKRRSALDWVAVVRGQLPASAIDAMTTATGLAQAELVRCLGLVERTIVRRKAQAELLTQDETEKLVRLARVLERASQVFADDERGLDWLRSPNPSLAGHSPLALLDTDIGVQMVLETLGRVEHGVFG